MVQRCMMSWQGLNWRTESDYDIGATARKPCMVPQVPRGASEAVVKGAYRRLQKKYHPDNSQVGCRRAPLC